MDSSSFFFIHRLSLYLSNAINVVVVVVLVVVVVVVVVLVVVVVAVVVFNGSGEQLF